MSKTYFFGFEVSRSGVLKVLFSSQYACHLGSTSAKGYPVLAVVCDASSAEVAEMEYGRKGERDCETPNLTWFLADGMTNAFVARRSEVNVSIAM